MKHLRHTLHSLLAAAAIWLLAAGSVSCDRGRTAAVEAPPSPDTLALVEGLRLFEEAEYDLAREQLNVSAHSTSTYIRAESQLYLNALETELGNYDVARDHLERYHAETRRLLLSAADSSHRVEEQTALLKRRQNMIVGGVAVIGLVVIGIVLFFVRRERRPKDPQNAASIPAIALEHDISDWQRYLADAEAFKQTDIWDELLSLAAQKPGRQARVLSSARQEVLDGELALLFSDFSARLRTGYPALTAGDVKLCCLSLVPLSNFARALCFGSVESNIIKQRKHTIKKKLGGDALGRALFGFIFETRG